MDEKDKKIVTIKIAPSGSLSFNAKEISQLREVLRISIGSHADKFSEEDLSEFGTSMIQATAVVLKAKHASRKKRLNLSKGR